MTTRYEPWSLLNQLQRDLMEGSRAAPAEGSVATAEWTPAVDIKERADGYVLFADVPGVRPEDIDVTMENGILTLRGSRNTEAGAAREGYKRIERVHGAFYRRFSLPDTADAEGISARYQNGVLEIVIPKRTAIQPKKIVISS
ncbi:MAG TPA: Hsp20/alpha crystallin family protein [Methylococcaceae bacterium]|nr:Hsp20/alpha crystallin family protein [Methylococcaceae bacterium]